jgi:hypothetical protein
MGLEVDVFSILAVSNTKNDALTETSSEFLVLGSPLCHQKKKGL